MSKGKKKNHTQKSVKILGKKNIYCIVLYLF